MVCGGQTHGNEQISECEMLKLTSSGGNRWEQLPAMTIRRDSCSAAAIGNKLVHSAINLRFNLSYYTFHLWLLLTDVEQIVFSKIYIFYIDGSDGNSTSKFK